MAARARRDARPQGPGRLLGPQQRCGSPPWDTVPTRPAPPAPRRVAPAPSSPSSASAARDAPRAAQRRTGLFSVVRIRCAACAGDSPAGRSLGCGGRGGSLSLSLVWHHHCHGRISARPEPSSASAYRHVGLIDSECSLVGQPERPGCKTDDESMFSAAAQQKIFGIHVMQNVCHVSHHESVLDWSH